MAARPRPASAPTGRPNNNQGHQHPVAASNKWPPHLVPLCVDGRTTTPQLPYVLDVARLHAFCELAFYARPQLKHTAPLMMAPSSGSVRRQSTTSSTPAAPSLEYVFATAEAGRIHLNGASFGPWVSTAKSGAESTSDDDDDPTDEDRSGASATSKSISDDDDSAASSHIVSRTPQPARPAAGGGRLRWFRLDVPNHVYLFRPATLEQQDQVLKLIPRWIAVCNLDVYNSPTCALHCRLRLLDKSGAGGGSGSDVSVQGFRFTFQDASETIKEQYIAHRGAQTSGGPQRPAEGAVATSATPSFGVSTAFGGLRANDGSILEDVADVAATPTLSGVEPCVITHRVNHLSPGSRSHVLLTAPFSIASTITFSVAVEHSQLGRLSMPQAQPSIALSRVFGLHRSADHAAVLPLVSPGGHAAYAAEVQLWWEPLPHESITLAIAAANLFRKGFEHADPMCRLLLKVSDREQPSASPRRSTSPTGSRSQLDAADGMYNVFEVHHYEPFFCSEAYRDRHAAAFRAARFALPIRYDASHERSTAAAPSVCLAVARLREHVERWIATALIEAGHVDAARSILSRHSNASTVGATGGPSPLATFTASWGGARPLSAAKARTRAGPRPPSAGKAPIVDPYAAVVAAGDITALAFSSLIPPHILPPVTTRERHVASVTYQRAFGACPQARGVLAARLPVLDPQQDVLRAEFIDCRVDPVARCVNPALIGHFEAPARLLIGTATHFALRRNNSYDDCNASSSAQLRAACGGFPGSFVALTPSTLATGASQLTSLEHQKRALRKGMTASLTASACCARSTYQDFFGGANPEWELAASMFLDCGAESFPAHRNQCFANGWNGYHGVIVTVNTALAPELRRGGCDIYTAAVGLPANQFAVMPLLVFPEPCGVSVDELVVRRQLVDGLEPVVMAAPKSAEDAAAASNPVSPIVASYGSATERDWNGELSVPFYDSRRQGVSRHASQTLPFFCCPVMRRAALRVSALQQVRTRLVEKLQDIAAGEKQRTHATEQEFDDDDDDDAGTEPREPPLMTPEAAGELLLTMPRRIFLTAIIVIGPGGCADFDEALHLIADLSNLPLYFVFVFIDSFSDEDCADPETPALQSRADIRVQLELLRRVPNARGVVMATGTGRFADLHESVEALQRALSAIPEAFLSFAKSDLRAASVPERSAQLPTARGTEAGQRPPTAPPLPRPVAEAETDRGRFRSAQARFCEAFGLPCPASAKRSSTKDVEPRTTAPESADEWVEEAAPFIDLGVLMDRRRTAQSSDSATPNAAITPHQQPTAAASQPVAPGASVQPVVVAPQRNVLTAAGEAVLLSPRTSYGPTASDPNVEPQQHEALLSSDDDENDDVTTAGRDSHGGKPGVAAHQGLGNRKRLADVTVTVVDLFQTADEAARRQQALRRQYQQQRAAVAAAAVAVHSRSDDRALEGESHQQRMVRLHLHSREQLQRGGDTKDELRAPATPPAPTSDNTAAVGVEDGPIDDDEAAKVANVDTSSRRVRINARDESAAAACGLIGTKVTTTAQPLRDALRNKRGGGAGGGPSAAVLASWIRDKRQQKHAQPAVTRQVNGVVVPIPPPPKLMGYDDAAEAAARSTYKSRVVRRYALPHPADLGRRLQHRGPLNPPDPAAERGHDDPAQQLLARAKALADADDAAQDPNSKRRRFYGHSSYHYTKADDYYSGLSDDAAAMLRWLNDPQQQRARGGPPIEGMLQPPNQPAVKVAQQRPQSARR